MLIIHNQSKTLLIISIEGEKILIYIISTLLSMAQVIIIIYSLITARVNLLRRYKQ